MAAGKTLVAAILALALSAGIVSVAAQIQQSESSVQSAVRDMRDGIPRAGPSTSRRALTGTLSAGTPPRPEARPQTGACARRDDKPCQK